jgi:hypothetical protein
MGEGRGLHQLQRNRLQRKLVIDVHDVGWQDDDDQWDPILGGAAV